MNKEIRYISLAISLVCLWNAGIQAQDMTVKAKAGTVEHTFLKVDLRIKLDSVKVGKREFRLFTPILSDGVNRQVLRPIMVNGKWRHLMYLRELNGKEGDMVAVRCGKRGAGMVEYTDSCIYQPWMQHAKLWLTENLYGCGCELMERNGIDKMIELQ